MQYNEKEEGAIAKYGVTHVVHDVLGIDDEVKKFMLHRVNVSSDQVCCHKTVPSMHPSASVPIARQR